MGSDFARGLEENLASNTGWRNGNVTNFTDSSTVLNVLIHSPIFLFKSTLWIQQTSKHSLLYSAETNVPIKCQDGSLVYFIRIICLKV